MTQPLKWPTRGIAIAFVAGMVLFLALDAVWLSTMAERLYRPAIGHLARDGFDPLPAGAFYVVYLVGVIVFCVLPSPRVRDALLRGALFGLVAYATYDLTNQATLRDWPWRVTLADLCWGVVVTGVSAAFARAVGGRFVR